MDAGARSDDESREVETQSPELGIPYYSIPSRRGSYF